MLLALAALVVPAQARASDSHGYPRTFHIWGGWYGAAALERYDMVVGYESNWDVAALRARNPSGVFLLSPGVRPGTIWDYDVLNITYGLEEWEGATCPAPLGYVPPLDPAVDLLRRPDGSVAAVNQQWGHPGVNLARPETAEKAARIFACAAIRSGLYTKSWDGVWSDNWIHAIGESWFYGQPLDTDLNGQADDFDDLRRRWQNGLNLVGQRLRAYLPGKVTGGNGIWFHSGPYRGDDPLGWLSQARATMMEYQNSYYSNADAFVGIGQQWLAHPEPDGSPRYFAVEQAAMNADGTVASRGGDPNDPAYMLDAGVMKGMRWGLTLALQTGAYFEVNPDQKHDARWWYDEYDGGVGVRQRGYLGQPLTGPRKLRNGLWRRDFDAGLALNNSTDSPLVIPLEAPYRRLLGTQNPALNDGSVATELTVPAHDGLILLRTVPFDPAAPDLTTAPPAPPVAQPLSASPLVAYQSSTVLRRRRLSVRLSVAERSRVTVVVRGPRGRVLGTARTTVAPADRLRRIVHIERFSGQAFLRISVQARGNGRLERVRVERRLSPRERRIALS